MILYCVQAVMLYVAICRKIKFTVHLHPKPTLPSSRQEMLEGVTLTVAAVCGTK